MTPAVPRARRNVRSVRPTNNVDTQLDTAIDHLLGLIAAAPRRPLATRLTDKSTPDNRRRSSAG